MKIKKIAKIICYFFAFCVLLYGISRLYYAITAGFWVSNISSDLPFDARWQTHVLSLNEKKEIHQALNQPYAYLGKGCQSYVFASEDGKYVLKFIKYQRFRPQAWISLFSFIPAIEKYQSKKILEKQHKLDKIFRSWKLAHDRLAKETGVMYVHLNKQPIWNRSLTISDKLGITHTLDLDQMEFLLQKRAIMLCSYIDSLAKKGAYDQGALLIDRLLAMLLSEYSRGYADNDHALMQNTGVLDGYPIHIDVGQFIYNEIVMDPQIYLKEIYDKIYKFQLWLHKKHPSLALHLRSKLIALLGIDYYYIGPYHHKGDVGKIAHQE